MVPTNLNLLPNEISFKESIWRKASFMEVVAELSQVDRSREPSALSSAKASCMFERSASSAAMPKAAMSTSSASLSSFALKSRLCEKAPDAAAAA